MSLENRAESFDQRMVRAMKVTECLNTIEVVMEGVVRLHEELGDVEDLGLWSPSRIHDLVLMARQSALALEKALGEVWAYASESGWADPDSAVLGGMADGRGSDHGKAEAA